MATTYYLRNTASDLGGAGQKALSTSRGAAASTAVTTTTAAGTNIQVTATAGGQALTWFSPQLAAITISGSITVNIRGLESAVAVNAGAGILIERCNSAGTVLSTILADTTIPATITEYTTSDTAKNASYTPTSTTLVAGDRIKITIKVRNVGTMGAGTVTNSYDGPTSAASGDSFVTFTENISLAPSTVTLTPAVVAVTAVAVTASVPSIAREWLVNEVSGGNASVITASDTPAGVTILVWHGNNFNSASALTGPTTGTWTLVGTGDSGNVGTTPGSHIKLWTGTAAGGAQTITVAPSPSGEEHVLVVAVLGGTYNVDGTPQGNGSQTLASALVANSVSPAGASAALLTAAAMEGNGAVVTNISPPAGHTRRAFASDTTFGMALAVGEERLTASGATGTRTWTASTTGRWSTLSATVTAGTTASSVTLTPAAVAVSGVALSPAAGPTSVTLTPVTVAVSAVAVTSTPVVTLTPAGVAVSAVALTSTLAVTLTPVARPIQAVALSPAAGPTSVTLTPAVVTLSAVAIQATPPPISLTLAPAGVVIGAVPLAPVEAVTLTPVIRSVQPVALSPAPGATSVTLTPAVVVLSGTTLGLGLAITLSPVTLQFGPVPLSLRPTVILTPAGVSLTATLLGVGGVSIVTLTPVVYTISARPLVPASGPTSVTLTPAGLILSVRPLSLTPVLALSPVVVALNAQPLVPIPTLMLSPASLALQAVVLDLLAGEPEKIYVPAHLGGMSVTVRLGTMKIVKALEET